MKAVAIQHFGDPDGLHVVDLPAPEPASTEVLVATEAAGVGGVDAMVRRGVLAESGFTVGHIPGGELAGTVTGVGDAVDASWIGRRVWAFTRAGGGYVEQAAVPVEDIVEIPQGLSAAEAVTVGSSGVVAQFALAHAHVAPGESVLVRGAAGGIGVMAVQLAARAGAGAIAVTTSSSERGRRLRELGATHVLDRSGNADTEAPEGYDVIIDVVCGADTPSFYATLNPNGRMVAVGVVGGMPPVELGSALVAAFQKSTSFGTFSLDTVSKTDWQPVLGEQFVDVVNGRLHPAIHELLPLDQAVWAHQKLGSGEVFGRIVLTP